MQLGVDETLAAFGRLARGGRGDSARGRNLHALLLLDLCWSDARLPLAAYRPRRRPGAFLAMVFDLLGEFVERDADGNPRAALELPLERFFEDLASSTPRLAAELEPLLRAALLDENRSTLPRFLTRLPLYLRPADLARVDAERVVAALPMAEVFAHLGYRPPEPGPGNERHPAGRDLRKALRSNLDAVWAQAMASETPGPLALAACFPLDLAELAARLPTPLPDFAFLYALATDGGGGGRRWRPSPDYLGDEDARPHFDALVREHTRPLARLGLSTTMPRTVARLDAWLADPGAMPELHAERPWRAWLGRHADEIELARLRFLARVGEAAP